MKEEKLQSLYYYFINKRDRIDNGSDGIFTEADETVSEFDSAYPPHRGITVIDGPILEGFNILPNLVEPVYDSSAQAVHHQVWEAQGATVQSNEIATIGANLLQIADEYSTSQPSKSPIKFEKHCIYVSPKEQLVSIPIIRSDKCLDKTNKVKWETCDKSAQSGTHFVASSGEVMFELGETKKNIQIRILTSNDASNDLRFTVKLSDTCGVFDPAPLTVVLKEIAKFYNNEISVLNNLDESQPYSVRDIRSILSDCLNQRTFYMGLSYLCSKTDTLNVQVALAFELARICRPKLREDIILNALSNFFAQDDIQP